MGQSYIEVMPESAWQPPSPINGVDLVCLQHEYGVLGGTAGSYKLLLKARRGAWWVASKTGLSPPPIETAQGWLVIYHGVRQTAAGAIYRLGLALFDLHTPERCLRRSDEWFFGPEEPYELHGDVGNVVFPCGYTLAPDGDTIRLYYGAADTCIALATGSVGEMLDWLEQHG